MDFEVFLVIQLKEHADAGEDPKRSVVSGLLTSGRVIAAAATIMGFGFGSFVLNGDPTVKPFGIGLALAVILDATAVRCLLVPARTASLGKANWYLPRWLGQILPASASSARSTSSPRSDPGRNPAPCPPGPGGAVVAAGRRTGGTTARVDRLNLRPARAYPASPSGEPAMPPAEEKTDVKQQVIPSPSRAPRPPGGHGSPARPGRRKRDQPPAR
jgi:hypothetical protein